jgi:N,N'-diacetyllegionaminate synthase
VIIAEAGVNHNGDLELAKKLIDVAADAGVDYVKFQTFKADKIVTQSAEKAQYQKNATGATESQYEMLKKLELRLRRLKKVQELVNVQAKLKTNTLKQLSPRILLSLSKS